MDIPPPDSKHGFKKDENVPLWLLEASTPEGITVVFGVDTMMTVSADGEAVELAPLGAGHLMVTLPDGEGFVGADGSKRTVKIRRS